MNYTFKKLKIHFLCLIILPLFSTGCYFENPVDCGDEFLNKINTMSTSEALDHLNSLHSDLRYLDEINSLNKIWEMDFNKECKNLFETSTNILFRLGISSILVQSSINGFNDLDTEQFYTYSIANLDSNDPRIVADAISILSFSNEINNSIRIYEAMHKFSDNRYIIDTGILFLAMQCNLDSSKLIDDFLAAHPELKDDIRINGYLSSAEEICQ